MARERNPGEDVLLRLVLPAVLFALAGGLASSARPEGDGRFTLRGTVPLTALTP